MNNGIAVSASEKLWIVSASSATEPVTTTITNCANGGHRQRGERDLDRTNPASIALQRHVDRIGSVVTVRAEDRTQHAPQPRWMSVLIAPVLVAVWRVRMAVVGVAGHGVSASVRW